MGVVNTKLYSILKSKCAEGEASPVSGDALLGTVSTACGEMANLLNRACREFGDYTLHDEHHAERVIFLMHRLMGDAAARLTPIDLALLILSAYGHDTGMCVGREQRERLENGDEYRDFLLRNERRWLEAETARESGQHAVFSRISDELFRDFLRGKHHELSAELMRGAFAGLLVVDGRSLVEPVADLCRSHGQPVSDVARLESFPFAGQFRCDMPFLACVLRLADYLDLDATRAPDTLLKLLDPMPEKSRREWLKHQANQFFVSDTQIEFRARFDDFFAEKALRDTLAGLEQERRECMELLRSRSGTAEHRLTLDSPVVRKITSVGYIYEEFQFQLEYHEIISLLMGTRLYKDERVFVRELLQNALDACRHAEAAAVAQGRVGYSGKLNVRAYANESEDEVLEISDNGSGMTRQIIRDYFMRVGRSYYQSFAFRRKKLPFQAVSQFGIGVLSCFMNSDYIEVETCPDPAVYEGADVSRKRLKLEIRGPYEFFVVRELGPGEPGTTVRVFLKQRLRESLRQIVERYVGRIPYTVEIQDHGEPPIELRKEPFDFSSERFATSFVHIPGAFGYATRDKEFAGKFGFELTGRIRFFLLEQEGRRALKLQDAGRYSFVGFSPEGETLVNTRQFTEEVRGPFDAELAKLRGLQGYFQDEVRADLSKILRDFERICSLLAHRHESEQVRRLWESLTAQINALYSLSAFTTNAACLPVEQSLKKAVAEMESFVTGEVRLARPSGVLTQDGINIGALVDLPARLNLGIGYLFNLDLCGKHRFTLNAARDGIVYDETSDALFKFLYTEIGAFLGKWFRAESIAEADVKEYVSRAPKRLAVSLERAYWPRAVKS